MLEQQWVFATSILEIETVAVIGMVGLLQGYSIKNDSNTMN